MNIFRWIIVAGGIFIALPAQAQDRVSGSSALEAIASDVGGTELILYRYPGVRDTESLTNPGVATVFQCTNFSGVTETLRIVVRDPGGVVLANSAFLINHLQTLTVSTHLVSFAVVNSLITGPISGGTAVIAATSASMVCTASVLDASGSTSDGVALHGIRFNPIPGSQE